MAGVQPPQPYPVSITSSTRPLPQNYQQKPFAAGSAMQAETTMSPGASQRGPKVPQTVSRVESAEKASPMERPPDTGPRVKEQDPRLSPDISIVKVENELGPEETGMLDMYVSDMGRSGAGPSHGQNDEDQSDYDVEEPPGDMHRDEMSNESGNLSMDQSGNWYMGNFRESKMLGVRWSFPKPSITKNHQGNIGFLCPVCGKVLKTKPGYRLHYKINHGEKTRLPACDVCGKHFHCVSRLESHKRSHSKDRDFVCLQCGRSFKYKNNLKSHSCNLKG
uniref:Zinc finger and BTB domain-containing protein 49-like isoform X7 n=1 Tax=Crassostrea virginica TaxID=6565 RepID=A0A8B8DPX9_CRAVI|nr:zinc finger and BTB domain-containing protein 49-like isoform X7 [Crassostrea virginica]